MAIIYAVIIYACRLSGFLLDAKKMPVFVQDYLSFVPIAVFSAFIVPAVLKESEGFAIRIFALAITGLLVWRFRRQGMAIFAGMGIFLLAQILH